MNCFYESLFSNFTDLNFALTVVVALVAVEVVDHIFFMQVTLRQVQCLYAVGYVMV